MASGFRALFLFSSFGPLYAIFAAKLWFNEGVGFRYPVIFAALSVLSYCVFAMLVDRFRNDNGTYHRVTDIKTKDTEILPYITTYIPQLLTRNMANPAETVPLVILYGLIFLLFMKLDALYLNPFFLLSGYRVYEGKLGNSKSVVTIVAKRIALGGTADLTLFEVGAGSIYYCEAE